MDIAQALGALLNNSLPANFNGQAQQRGQNSRKEPTGVIPVSLGADERLEARYWENSVKGTNEIRVGYSKPRLSETSQDRRPFHSYQLRHAIADIEATYRVCERALYRHLRQEICLTEADRVIAEEVVKTFGGCFSSHQAPKPGSLTNGSVDLSSLLVNGG